PLDAILVHRHYCAVGRERCERLGHSFCGNEALRALVGDALQYVTVFEITHQAIMLWFPLSFVLFSMFGVIFVLLARESGSSTKRVWYLILLFGSLWTAFCVYYFVDRRNIMQTYREGKYKTIEGTVEHYSRSGKVECFSLRGEEFCHGTANIV